MESQICTTKEQSTRLLKLGVRAYTADMIRLYMDETGEVKDGEDVRQGKVGNFYYTERNVDRPLRESIHFIGSGTENLYRYDAPAWSLSTLIEMLPPHLDGFGTLYMSAGLHTKRYNADNRTKDHQYFIQYGVNYTSGRYDNPFDALIDTIEWLIKVRGRFNKAYLKESAWPVLCGGCIFFENEDTNGEAWCESRQRPVRCDTTACKDIEKKH